MPEIARWDRRSVLRLAAAGLALGLAPLAPARAAPDGAAQQRWFALLAGYRGLAGPFTCSIDIKSYQDQALQDENQVDVYFRSHRRVLIAFRAPQSVVGRRILIHDDDMWLAMPTSSRVLRILPSQRLLGEASNGDLINLDFGDYALAEEGNRTENGEPLVYLKIVARADTETYQTIEYLLGAADRRPRISRHYAASGKLMKTIEYLDFVEVDGAPRSRTLKLINPLVAGQYTLMSFDRYRAKSLPDGLFDKAALLDATL